MKSNLLFELHLIGNLFGRIAQVERNIALINIPAGTIAKLSINESSPPSAPIPIAAGIIVVGIVPSIPPKIPPYFSISTVTVVATSPAITAASIAVCPSMAARVDVYP